jgi:ABC-type Na+ efflux pump permease subunit
MTLAFFVTLMSLNATIGSMSTDAICGERERGTFDTLILSGVKPSAIVLGKMSFVSLIGFFVLLINSVAFACGMCYVLDGTYEFFNMHLNGNM